KFINVLFRPMSFNINELVGVPKFKILFSDHQQIYSNQVLCLCLNGFYIRLPVNYPNVNSTFFIVVFMFSPNKLKPISKFFFTVEQKLQSNRIMRCSLLNQARRGLEIYICS